MYASYARANREPNRGDYENGNPEPESLDDFELGWRFAKNNTLVNANVYYMVYKNQLVNTGALDDVGAPIRANSGESFRLGIEIDANVKLSEKFSITPNASFSVNKNKCFNWTRSSFTRTCDYVPSVFIINYFIWRSTKNSFKFFN